MTFTFIKDRLGTSAIRFNKHLMVSHFMVGWLRQIEAFKSVEQE